MKKIYTLLFACIGFLGVHATSFTITISGFNYSPATLTVSVGDVVTIQGSAMHPLVQVDQTTWNAAGSASLSSGWGIKTTDHTFTITSANAIYYVCQNHVGSGMKGQIVTSSTGINESSILKQTLSVFPIPASEKMNVNYTLIESGMVTVNLIGLNGQHIASLLNEVQAIGIQQKEIGISANIASGVYFLQISINGSKTEERLISIK